MKTSLPHCIRIAALLALAFAIWQAYQLHLIAPILWLTTPLTLLPYCLFGCLVACCHATRYPLQSTLAALLAVLTALLV